MKAKKRLAAEILKTSAKKVTFAADALEEITKAITRSDLRGLIAIKKITVSGKNLHSRSGARKVAAQKRKGRRKGKGSKKGSKNAIVNKKEKWMSKVRAQRVLLKSLREKGLLSQKNYRLLYAKSKGGYFRNRRHIKLYATERHLLEKKQ